MFQSIDTGFPFRSVMPSRRQTRSGRSRPSSPSPSSPANSQPAGGRTTLGPRHRRPRVGSEGSPAPETPRGSLSRSPRRRIRFEDELGDRAAHERELAAARRQKRRDTGPRTPGRGGIQAIRRPLQTPARHDHRSPIRRTWGPDLTRQRAGINEALRRNERLLPGQAAPDGLDEDVDYEIQREMEEDRARQRAVDAGYLFSAAVIVRVKRGSMQSVALKKDIILTGERPWCGPSSFDMDMLNEIVTDVIVSKHLNPQFENIYVVIKSPKANVANEGATMEGLTREEFSRNVEPVLGRLWRSSPGYELMIYVNINALPETSGSAQSAVVPSGSGPSPSTPPPRRTRTVQQEERAAANRDANEAAGNFIEKLIDKWRCHSDTCRNRGQNCYIPPNGLSRGKHFVITQTMFDLWSDRLRSGDIDGDSDLIPPASIERLILERGPVDTSLKHPSAKERREAEQERRENEKAAQEERREQARLRREEQQDRLMDNFYKAQTMQMDMSNMQYHQRMMQQTQTSMMPLDPPPLPRPQNPPIAQSAAQTAPARSPNRSSVNTTHISMAELGRSSPLAERSEEELAWEAFWQWKSDNTQKPEKRQAYLDTKRICDMHFWSFNELKGMSDRQSDIYKLGLQAEIPDGLMKHFHDDISEFKPYWRNVCKPQIRVANTRYRERDREAQDETTGGF